MKLTVIHDSYSILPRPVPNSGKHGSFNSSSPSWLLSLLFPQSMS